MSVRYLSAALRRLQVVIMESHHALIHWGTKLGRAQSEGEVIRKRIEQLDNAHPHWTNPDMDDVAVNIKVLVLLPVASAIDAIFLSAAADYAAKVFFPKQLFMAVIARILVPPLMVWIEATLGVLINIAEETPRWDGSRHEYRILTAIGYGFVLVTPLLVVATFFAASAQGENDFPLLAFVFALFAAVLHLAVLKSGRWIRQAIGWLAFTLTRNYLCWREKAVEKKHDEAAESVFIAYPVFKSSSLQFSRMLPDDSSAIMRLPEAIEEAILLLLKGKNHQQLSLNFDSEQPIPKIDQNSEGATPEDEEV